MSEYKLINEIIEKSENNLWDKSKLEWKLIDVKRSNSPARCLCGHYPITNLCYLANKINSNTVIVGNCCVKKFMGIASDKIFQSIGKIDKDNEKSLNIESIEHAYKKKWIND